MRPDVRWQDDLIEKEIPKRASVLDLGCNDGLLLGRLSAKRRARVQGIELDTDSVGRCVERGVPVIHADLDAGLGGFLDKSFDYVILEETLQTLHRPVFVLGEMLRVGRRGIVSFPNFGYWRVRLQLAATGRMPVTERLPYKWHDTPNIHLLTLDDFKSWARSGGIRVVKGYVLADGLVREMGKDDNLIAEEALLVLEQKERK
jgi:methionine biosynthesis protein MetW